MDGGQCIELSDSSFDPNKFMFDCKAEITTVSYISVHVRFWDWYTTLMSVIITDTR